MPGSIATQELKYEYEHKKNFESTQESTGIRQGTSLFPVALWEFNTFVLLDSDPEPFNQWFHLSLRSYPENFIEIHSKTFE